MKTIITLLIFLSLNTFSSEGAYNCSVIENNYVNSIGNKVINAKSYINKFKELSKLGDQKASLKQLDQADHLLQVAIQKIESHNFCYSYKAQTKYMLLNAERISLESKVLRQRFRNSNSCDFSIKTLKLNFNKYRSIASYPHKNYIELSKNLNRTNILLSSKDCNLNQKKKLFTLFDEQSNTLEKLYIKMKE